MTVGIFDGVHRGHQCLLNKIVSHNVDYVPVVVTFKENHKIVRSEGLGVRSEGLGVRSSGIDIQSFEDRLAMFEKLGIQITIVIEFTEEFKHMPGIEFLDVLLKHGGVGFFAVGSNFRCGYQLDTDAKVIQNFFASREIAAEIVQEVCHPTGNYEESLPISSSRIRAAIGAGNIPLAEDMLGHFQF